MKTIFEPGLNQEVVKKIAEVKNESDWMLDLRLESYKNFLEIKNPNWGPNLDWINFDEIIYYTKHLDQKKDWSDIPDNVKEQFEKLGIPEAERKFLAGLTTQLDSEAIYHKHQEELNKKGVIFLSTDEALKKHPDLFKKYFGTVVKNNDNKYTALNGAVWSGGTFIYVPPNTELSMPLQSYFRIQIERAGQFERTLIIVDENSKLNYIEGCTAPTHTTNKLHAAVVEIIVHKNATMRYTTIQNWSTDVLNLVTKRAFVHENGHMEWIDGNIGSGINMKYPSCILFGDNSTGFSLSMAMANQKKVIQDVGSKMIHLGKNTSSQIISKSIGSNYGIVNYRGLVKITKRAINSKSIVECDTLLLDKTTHSITHPLNIINNQTSKIEHEASISQIDKEQLFYLQLRGIDTKLAKEMIVIGFVDLFARELPLEYAVELNRLINMNMEGSVG